MDTRPTIAALLPFTITHPPACVFDPESSRRNPSAYPTGSRASRIGCCAENIALYPTVSPGNTSRNPITRVFHVITGRTHGLTRPSLSGQKTPEPFAHSIGRQYP